MKPTFRPASFTLVEMLVALAIFSLLGLLIFQIMSYATLLWRTQAAKEQNFEEARAALNTIARDVSSAVISTNVASFYAAPNQFAFLTTLPSDAQNTNIDGGDICAVGYSLEYGTNDVSGVQTNMSLYRYVRFSNPTYQTNIVQNEPVSGIFNSADGTTTVRELIAKNIAQVSFVGYANNAAGNPEVLTAPTTLPPMVDVSLVALNDKAAATLTTQAQWENTTTPVFLQNEETFTLRVRPQNP
jgi:prepilin-type N-terminal cleavage/methylation domain-containing protein